MTIIYVLGMNVKHWSFLLAVYDMQVSLLPCPPTETGTTCVYFFESVYPKTVHFSNFWKILSMFYEKDNHTINLKQQKYICHHNKFSFIFKIT